MKKIPSNLSKYKHQKAFLLPRLTNLIVFFFVLFVFSAVFSNPIGGNVSSGNAKITNTGNTTTIHQTSGKAIINWQSFNIHKGEKTTFEQPKHGIALNRINPLQGVSTIFGKLTANGKIILINSSGIYFGPGAYVNVGGIIATTADISDKNFLSNNYQFTAVPNEGSIINEGTIIAKDHGLIALVGPGVVNNGMIEANLGHVVLASGNAFTMSFANDDLINFRIDVETSAPALDNHGNKLNSGVTNNGKIFANGGKILVTAKATEGVLNNVINMNGIAVAKSVSKQNGEIILSGEGGVVKVAGTLNASGSKLAKGGKVKVLGDEVYLANGAIINASSDIGGGEVLIGGDYQGKNPNIPNAKYTYVDHNVNIYSDSLQNGNGGKVILWSNLGTTFYGNIFTRGGAKSGNGGFVEVSGKDQLVFAGHVNGSAPHGLVGSLLLDPTNLNIIDGPAGAGDQDSNTSGGTVNFTSPDTTNNTISVGQLQSLGDININLQAKNTITIGSSTGQSAQLDLSNTLFTGTLTLQAGDSTTIGGGNIIFNNGSTITTGGGAVNLIAGNATQGTGSASLGAILTNGGDITVTAQQAVTVNGELNSGSGSLNLIAGTGLLTINQNMTSQDNNINLSGAGIVQAANTTVNAGSGTLTLNAGNNAITTNNGSTLLSLSTVSLSAHTMNLGGAQIGGDTLGNLANHVIFTGTNGESIGIAGGIGDLTLSSSALNTVNASNVRIGDSTAGAITVGTFTVGANFANGGALTLDSGSTISQTGTLNLGHSTSLLLRDATSVVLNDTHNVISRVAAVTVGNISVTNQSSNSMMVSGLTDDIGTVNGITTNGSVTLTTSGVGGSLNVNQNIFSNNHAILLSGNGLQQAGNVIINAGSGALTLNAGSNILSTGSNSALLSTGTVTLIGNSMLLSGSQIGGDTSGGLASNVIFQPGSSGVSIGLAGASGSISLTTARLNTVQASNVRIGNSTTGIIRIGAWTPNANFAKNGVLTLDSASQILQTGALNLGTNHAGLLIRDSSNVILTNGGNVLSNVVASVNGPISISNTTPLIITSLSDDLGLVNGVTSHGAVSLSSSGLLSVNQNINSTNNAISLTALGITLASNKAINAGTSNISINAGTNTFTLNSGSNLLSSAKITITSDNMAFDAAAQIGGTSSGVGHAATVILQQSTAGLTIGLAGGAGSLSLSTIALNDIRTTNLRIGNSLSGNMNIGAWTPNANVATGVLTLDTGGTLTQSGPINLANNGAGLILRDSSNVTLNDPNNVFGNMAVAIHGGLTLRSASPFTITTLTDDLGTVYGISAGAMALATPSAVSINQDIVTNGGNIDINAGSGISLGSDVNSNGGDISLNDVFLSSDASVDSGNGNITFGNVSGGENITLNSGSSGDIHFNGDSNFNTLNIINANNVFNNGIMNTMNFIQNAGNITNLGSGNHALNSTGNTNITVNNVIGNLAVENLTLDVHAANLFGTVGGFTGIPAILKTVNVQNISGGTHFLNNIDMFLVPNTPTPSNPPSSINMNNKAVVSTVMNSINPNLNSLAQISQPNIIVNNLPATVSGITAGALSNANAMRVPNAVTAFNILPTAIPFAAHQLSAQNQLPRLMNRVLKSLEQVTMDQRFSLGIFAILSMLLLLGARRRQVQAVTVPQSMEAVSFKLRTALNGINGFAELLYHEKSGTISTEQKEFLTDIMSSSDSLLNYIKEFSSTESPRLKQEFMKKLSFKLRTALTGIKGFAELMYQGVVGDVTTREKEYLSLMLSSSDEALQAI